MTQQIVVKNLLISYATTTHDDGPCLLFLHGWRSNKEIWNNTIQKLENSEIRKFRIMAIDLPGFGGSQIPASAFEVGDYAEVIKEFIEKLSLKDVIVVGHSFGGRVGIKLAAQYPSIISKLILVDSAGFAMEASRKNIYRSLAKIAKPFFRPRFMQSLRKKIYHIIGAEDYLATPQLQSTFVKVTAEDLSQDLKKIICPTLIIFGESDTDTPVEYGEKMESLITNSNLVVLNDAGHFSFLDQPEEFISTLSNFID